MATTEKASVEIEGDLLERARRAARERGVEVPQLVHDALEHELGGEQAQPPFSLIGAFTAGRDDLSARASRDEFEPRPFR